MKTLEYNFFITPDIFIVFKGKQMMYNMPWVYDYNMPDYFAKTSPQMALVLQNKHVEQEPWNNTVVLQSKEGQKFISFAKYRKFDAGLVPFILPL